MNGKKDTHGNHKNFDVNYCSSHMLHVKLIFYTITHVIQEFDTQIKDVANNVKLKCQYSQLPPCGHLSITDTPLLRTAAKYPRRNKLPPLRTLASTDLRTLYSVPKSQFYCFLPRYSGHRAASWNICTHIKSIFSAF